MSRILHVFFEISRKYAQDEVSVYAAQASFFIILAAFPFFMLLLSLIDMIPMIHESDLLSFLVQIMPDNLDALVIRIIVNLQSHSPAAIVSASAFTALWSSSRGMLSIERGLNRIYDIPVQRNYFLRRLICSGYTFLFTIMCVLSLTLLVFGDMLESHLFQSYDWTAPFHVALTPIRRISAFFILMLFFLAFYTVLPFQKQTISRQIPGALFSAIGWSAFSMAFSFYFKYFGRHSVAYGSLTAMILMMLWLYFCICILFIGAEINHYLKP